MKIALLGKGKTGSKIISLAEKDYHQVTVFDTTNQPTMEKLQGHDVIISFLPGEPFLDLTPLLIEVKIPVVTGSTGFNWPTDLEKDLVQNNVSWIWGHNFSMGINLVKSCLEILGKAKEIFPEVEFQIHEVHHTKKLDAPSGTAISFQNWLNQENTNDINITSERTGDVVGIHELTVKTNFESITLKHQAHDRNIFANGAIFAADYLVNNPLKPGLHNFSDFMNKHILKFNDSQ